MCCRRASTRRCSKQKTAMHGSPISSPAIGSCAARRGRSTTSARSAATTPDDERRFATAARVSEINLALYRTFVQPFVRALVNAASRGMDARDASAAAAIRAVLRRKSLHGAGRRPGRAGARTPEAGGRRQSVPGDAGKGVRADRRRAGCLAGDDRERCRKRTFLAIYGSPRCRPRSASTRRSAAAAQGAARTRCTSSCCEHGSPN